MNAADAARELEQIAGAGDDFEWQSGQLTSRWESDPTGFEAVEPILRFIENHPDVEYGTPGPLIHFVETFPNYDEKLFESIKRQPTPDTVGMLNRVINGKRNDPQEWRAVVSVLERVLENPAADPMTRSRARYYLDHQMLDPP